MQTQLIVSLFLSLFAISTSVIAEECGSRSGDSVYVMDCIAERYQAADKELNELYHEAMKSLTDEGKKKLENAQQAWLKYRDVSLAFITEINRKTGSTGNVIIEDYRVTLVKKRIAELQYVLKGPAASPAEW
ncbi:MAG: DUF1311 domain-containing protein [Candidatus Competibacteraceae bacterium]|nr:DUF1311 domain-containing protein [Candidatus Competibacteraceae bacterium]